MEHANGSWLAQKLLQNGFTVQDLAAQTDLDANTIQAIIDQNEADPEVWTIILGTLNQYPTLYYPASDLIQEIQAQMEATSPSNECTVYYGVNQGELVFALCRFDDGSLHGANVAPDYLHTLSMPLEAAKELFFCQQASLENATAKN
ncbi:MAG: hypothetical protein HDR44_03695 [Allobaculum sp.]|nr:hypothetical protein [Allobaculum sp.]